MQNTFYCKNCGSAVTLSPGKTSGFCGMCGSRVELPQEYTQPSPAQNASGGYAQSNPDGYAQGSYGQTNTGGYAPGSYGQTSPGVSAAGGYVQNQYAAPAKKSGKKPVLVVAIVAVLVIVAVLALLAVNAFAGSSYQKAESRFIQNVMTALPLAKNTGSKVDFTLQYDPGSDLAQQVKSMALSGDISVLEQKALANLTVTYDGDKADGQVAYDGTEATVSVPDASKYALRYALNNSDQTANIDFSKLDMGKLQTTAANIVKEYTDITEKAAQVDKGVDLTGGDVTVKCDRYTINFTEKMSGTLEAYVSKEIRANQNLMDFITNELDTQSGDGQSFSDSLDQMDKDAADKTGSDVLFRMTVWVKDDKTIARTIDKVKDGGGTAISYQYLVNGGKAHIAANIATDGNGFVTYAGDFTQDSGAWSGSGKLTVGDAGSLFTVNMTCDKLKLDGTTLVGAMDFTKAASKDGSDFSGDIKIVFGKDGNNQTVKLSGNAGGGGDNIDLGQLSLSYGVSVLNKIAMPDYNDVVVADDTSDKNVANARNMLDELQTAQSDHQDNAVMSIIIEGMMSAAQGIAGQ